VNYLSLTGQSLAPSSFYERFDEPLARLMAELVQRALRAVHEMTPANAPNEFTALLRHFSAIRITDSTCHFLKRFAEAWAPSTDHKRPAAFKLHAVINAVNQLPITSSVGPQRTHDNKAFPEETMEPGTLSLFDLGYIDLGRFIRATKAGAYFITRLKQSHNPRILSIHRGRGPRRQIVGLTLDEALKDDKLQFVGGVLDLEVELCADGESEIGRVIGIRDADGDVHWYLTNVPAEILDAADVAETYRMRWLVELFFKQAKSGAGFSAIRAWRPEAVQTLVHAKIIALALSRMLELVVAREKQDPQATVRLALVLTLTRAAPLLLHAAYIRKGVTLEELEERIILIAATVARSRSKRREAEARKRRERVGTSSC
jgi:hypothetical protein